MQSLRPIIVPHNRNDPNERKYQVGDGDRSDYVSITPLGSGQEVGRSCLIIKYKGKSVMLDCGLHPALKGQDAMPYLDFLDLENVDLLLVTHFHLDHAACLPYFLSKTSFKSRCFMTHPTKSIYKLILQDFVKVSTLSSESVLFGEKELLESMERIDTVDYHQDTIVNGIRFRAYHAGHVLGAAMFMIEIANVKILYTGDYSCDDDRHLKGAEIPNEKPDILIIESTFGTQSLRPVRDREKEFTGLVHQIIKRGGRCLIPVFALGRAQELLLIMDEYWSNNKTLHHVPIYYASALAKKCLQVYQTYINMMNPRIQQQYKVSNPFEFKHVFNLRSRNQFNDVGPSVVFASPGMLQNGLSRELFEMWCTDRRNGLVIPGYAVEGTLAKIVQSEPREVDGMRGNKLPLRMTVHYVMFAAHADHDQTKRFIQCLKPPNVILVHGERKAMSRVKMSLNRSFGEYIRISDPANCQSVQIEFRKDKICKVVGNLVDTLGDIDADKNNFDGLLIRKDFNYHIMAPRDLSKFTPLTSTQIEQSLMIPFNQSFTALSLFISRIYDIKYIENEKKIIVHVVDNYKKRKNKNENDNNNEEEAQQEEEDDSDNGNDLSIILEKMNKKHIRMSWKSSPISDMIADSVIGLALTLDVDPSTAIAQQMMQSVHDHNDSQNRQSQPHPASGNRLSSMLPSKEAFEFILSEHFGAEQVECIVDDSLLSANNDNKATVLWNNRNVVRYKYVVHYEGSSAVISFKYNYKKMYDTKEHQQRFWSSKKEKLENGLKEKEKETSTKKKNKIQKKLSQFEHILSMIEENESGYFDEQFIPCFEVQSDDEALKGRIESILYCVDTALYPISCDFNCLNDYESVFVDRENDKNKAIELALDQIKIDEIDKKVEKDETEQQDVKMENVQNVESKKRTASDSGISDNDNDIQPPSKKMKLTDEDTANMNETEKDGDVAMHVDETVDVEVNEEINKEQESVNVIVEEHESENENVPVAVSTNDVDENEQNENEKDDEVQKENETENIEEKENEDVIEIENENENEEEEEEDAEEEEDLDIDSMTVYELKNQLRSRGLKLGGKKAELKKRLIDALAETKEGDNDNDDMIDID